MRTTSGQGLIYLVVNAIGLIGVLNQLVDRQGCVVWLDNSIRHFGGRNHREGGHHSVGELFSDLGDQQRSHTGTSTATKRVGDLEALEAIAALSFTANDIKDLVDKLSTLGVVTLGPVVAWRCMLLSCSRISSFCAISYQLHSDQRQSYQDGRVDRMDQPGLHPWYRVRDRQERHGGHICFQMPGTVRTWCQLNLLQIHTSLKYTFIRSSWRSEVPL